MNIPFSIIFITIFNKFKFHIDKLKRNLRLKIENVSRVAMWKIKKKNQLLKRYRKRTIFNINLFSHKNKFQTRCTMFETRSEENS